MSRRAPAALAVRPALAEDFPAWFRLFEAVAGEGRWLGREAPVDWRRRNGELWDAVQMGLVLDETSPGSPHGGAAYHGRVKPSGLHHVSVNVVDVDAALAFYVGALGLEVRTDRPDLDFGGAWLDVGGQQVHLIEATPPPDRGQHFALAVEDIGAFVAALRDRGVEVSEPRLVGTGLQAFCSDPSGNLVELQQLGVEPT